jgi:hypothetical protein
LDEPVFCGSMEIETFASRVSLRAPGRWRVMRAHPVVSLGEKSPAGDESFVPGAVGIFFSIGRKSPARGNRAQDVTVGRD